MTKVNLNLKRTGNVGIIRVPLRHVQLAKRVDLYATIAWATEKEYLSGWEYFIFFANKLGLEFEILFEDDMMHNSYNKECVVDVIADDVDFDYDINYEIEFRRFLQEFHDEINS